MKIKWQLLSLILLVVISTYIYAFLPESLPSDDKVDCNNPNSVIKLYFEAIDRGELKVFNKVITRSQLVPVNVVYEYKVNSGTPDINVYKVFSEFKEPIKFPAEFNGDFPGVSGIKAIINPYGKIIETEIHVWQQKE